MKKTVLISLLCMISLFSWSFTGGVKKDRYRKNTFFVEILGNSLPYALCYERIWSHGGMVNIGTAIGGGHIPLNKYPMTDIVGEINCFFGESKHKFELSLGFNYFDLQVFPDDGDKSWYAAINSAFRFAYRFQKRGGGFFFRGSLVALQNILLLSDKLEETILANALVKTAPEATWALPGISLGYTF